jgi:hypothetical protein
LKDLHRIGEEIGLPGRKATAELPKMTSLFLIYDHQQQTAFEKLMDSIRTRAKELGISIKAADLPDI